MAISEKNQKRLANMAPNLIYTFIPESELNYDVFGKSLNNILLKREAQNIFINAVRASDGALKMGRYKDFVREQLEDVYGMSVKDVIYYLAKNGSLPAAKYEKDALAGIRGSIGSYTEKAIQDVWNSQYKQPMTFNPSTSKLQIGTGKMYTSTNYDTFGNTWKNYYSPSAGLSATALKTGGSYTLISGSNGESTIDLSTGEEISPKKNNFWNGVNNALPAIQGLLDMTLKILQQTLTPYQMSPNQVADGWVYPPNNASNNLTTGLILTGLVGGAVLLSNKK